MSKVMCTKRGFFFHMNINMRKCLLHSNCGYKKLNNKAAVSPLIMP